MYDFYNKTELDYGMVISDIVQLGKNLLMRKGFILLEMPLKDIEMNAFFYDGGKNCKYVIMNTQLSRINNNFAIAHEFYHVFFHKKKAEQEAERYIVQYDCDIEESFANAFAGNILMPEKHFKLMYKKFNEANISFVSDNVVNQVSGTTSHLIKYIFTLVELMCYYKTTYMSVLIRCCELELLDLENEEIINVLLNYNDDDKLRELMKIFMLDTTLLNPTLKNDFETWKINLSNIKKDYVEMGYASEEDICFTINQLNSYYDKITGSGGR